MTKIIDWLTQNAQWIYNLRRSWCERKHQWVQGDRGMGWVRRQCEKCGFWSECG